MFDKKELAKEIGNYFGDYFEDGNQFCINNGLEVFRYDSLDLLLADWVDTVVENHHDTINDPVSDFFPTNNSWEKEIVFIYSEVIGVYPRGVRPVENKDECLWKASVDVVDGSRHGKNLHLGTYSSIVDAIFARKEFFDLTKDYVPGFDLDKIMDIAREIQESAKQQRQSKKAYLKEKEIRSKYDLSTLDGVAVAVKTAQELSQDNSIKSIYEAAWLNGYANGLQDQDKQPVSSLNDKIRAASALAGKPRSAVNAPHKKYTNER